MARARRSPVRSAPAVPEQFQAIINFHRSCNTEIVVNTESKTVVIKMTNMLDGKTYTATATMEEI